MRVRKHRGGERPRGTIRCGGSRMSQRLAVLRSVTIVSVSTYIEYVLGLVASIWIARALGPADFGRYAFTVWLCGWLIICSNHALTTSSTKFIAEALGSGSTDVAAHIAHRLSWLQHVSSFVVVGLFIAATCIVRPTEWGPYLVPATAAIAVSVIAKASYAMLVAIEKGQERFEPEAIATVLAGILGLVLIIAAASVRAELLAFIAIFTVSCLTLNLVNRFAFRRYGRAFFAGPIPRDLLARLNRHLRLTAVLVLLGSFRSRTIETVLLNAFATTTAVGYFSIAATLTNGAVQLFSVGLTTTLLPYMAKLFGQHGHEHAARALTEATRFYWAVGIAIAGLGLVTTPGIVTLMYGSRYVEAIPAIESTIVLSGLLLLGAGISAYQTVVDRQDDRIRITVIALCVNAVLGILLIPPLGLTGAVMTYVGTRTAEFGLAVVYLRRATTTRFPAAAMLRLFGVGCVATAIAWLVTSGLHDHRYAFVAGALVFVVLYVPMSVFTRYWTDDDFRLMRSITGRLGAPGRFLMRTLEALRRTRSRLRP